MGYKHLWLIVLIALVPFSAGAQQDLWLPRYDTDNSGVSPTSMHMPASLRWKHTITDAEAAVPVATAAVGAPHHRRSR